MAKTKTPTPLGKRKRRPAVTPENREDQLISEAYDLVEQRLLDGTATSQETVHFLRLGSRKARIEQEILEKQKELVVAKTEAIQSAKRIEELYNNAMRMFTVYTGEGDPDEDVLGVDLNS